MYTSIVRATPSPTPAGHQYALALEGVNEMRLVGSRHVQPKAGEVVIEARYVAICGTDLEVIEGSSDRARPPLILGHEWAGRVVAVGPNVDRHMEGAFVVGENVIAPGTEIGFDLPGGFASHFLAPARNLHRLPASLQVASACLMEPLAVAVHACTAAQLAAADSVLVLGDGLIGLFVARVASLTAARVQLVGHHEDRLGAATKLGVPSVTREQPERDSWSAVFEASGKPSGLSSALAGAAPHARVVLLGDYGSAPVDADVTTIVRKELRVLGSNASSGAWPEAVRLAVTSSVDLERISPIVLPIDDWASAIQAARERRALRVILRHRAADRPR
jgi:2-desacetyl-2-hydroxyethyl bacteriochlorophyllide A dehydrogenase